MPGTDEKEAFVVYSILLQRGFARLSKSFFDNDKSIYSNLDRSFIYLFIFWPKFIAFLNENNSLKVSHFNLLLALFTKELPA